MLKKIVLALAAFVVIAVGIVLVLAAGKPDELRVERSIVIAAPADVVFAQIDDFRQWERWSAYETKDPDMQRTHSGPPRGVGATYAWDGDDNVGLGSMEIVQSQPPRFVQIDLRFVRPMQTQNLVDITLAPETAGTRVTWTMHGPALFITKVMQVFFDMDEMIGRDFAAGLFNLKQRVESGAR